MQGVRVNFLARWEIVVQPQPCCSKPRIDQNMPLLALDQLAGIEAVAVDASPPFSALFTLWLSMIVGLANRLSRGT